MKFLNYEGLGHLISEFKGRFVQKITGKDLSSNDFTNTLKQKLDGIESGAEVNTVNISDLTAHTEATGNVHNIAKASTTKDGLMSLGDKKKLDDIESGATTNTIEIIKRNGAVLDVDVNKTVDIDIPTKFSDLSNDKTYQTKSEIIGLISEHGKLKREVVTALPQVVEADDNTMYLVANEDRKSVV